MDKEKHKSKPKNGDRNEMINWRLQEMYRRAIALRDAGWNRVTEASNQHYIRIKGESLQAVSLDDKRALCGIGDSAKTVDAIKVRLKNNEASELAPSVFESKKERRLQASLIMNALKNGGSLLSVDCFRPLSKNNGGDLDELIFVMDEISFGDNKHFHHENDRYFTDGNVIRIARPNIVRIDIFAVGVKEGVSFPVLIELKSSRDKTTLISQLNNAQFEVCGESQGSGQRTEHIQSFVCAVTGRNFKLAFDKARKVIVWPALRDDPIDQASSGELKDITVIEYWPKDFSDPNCLNFPRVMRAIL